MSNQKISITTPKSDEKVARRVSVKGILENVALESATVWLIIHPRGNSKYWVQPKAIINPDGSWITEEPAFVGRDVANGGTEDIGHVYEFRAILNPNIPLELGMELTAWPEGEAASEIVEVIRA